MSIGGGEKAGRREKTGGKKRAAFPMRKAGERQEGSGPRKSKYIYLIVEKFRTVDRKKERKRGMGRGEHGKITKTGIARGKILVGGHLIWDFVLLYNNFNMKNRW